MADGGQLTELLKRWRGGDREALNALIPEVYQELRRAARARLARERAGHSLQPTDLVHEVFVRLDGYARISWRDRAHFYAVAARVMRRVLIDRARRRDAARRGGGEETVALIESGATGKGRDVDLVALDEALERLAQQDPRQCDIVEMKYFGGLSQEEIAGVLEISVPTVKRDWRVAKLWLRRELSASG
jgi:RNA polymerase sigma factor (TIGR02999 family)